MVQAPQSGPTAREPLVGCSSALTLGGLPHLASLTSDSRSSRLTEGVVLPHGLMGAHALWEASIKQEGL